MKILPLEDNALFMRSWWERMRGHVVLSYAILALCVIALIFVSCYFSPQVIHHYTRTGQGDPINIPWLRSVFYYIAVAQGVLLFLLGLSGVYRTATQENVQKTLDFHRVSPTPRVDQVVGLVLGAPILEIIVFLGTLAISLVVALLSHINLFVVAAFYLKLMSTAVLWYLLVTLLALVFSSLKIPSGQLFFFLLIYCGVPAVMFMNQSPLSLFTCFPAYAELYTGAIDSYVYSRSNFSVYSFYGIKMMPLLAQAFVQLPLILILVLGIIRRITHPLRPVFSKMQFTVLSLFILFVWTGSAVSVSMAEMGKAVQHYYRGWDNYGSLAFFTFFLLGFGIMGALNATPNLAQLMKGIRRLKKLGLKKFTGEEDESPSGLWQICFIIMAGVFYTINICLVQKWSMVVFLGLVVVLSQILFFSSLLQYFRLSVHYQKKSWLSLFLTVLWILIPILGLILQGGAHLFTIGFYALSPFFTVFSLEPYMKIPIEDLQIAAALNLVFALVIFVLDAKQKQKLLLEFRR